MSKFPTNNSRHQSLNFQGFLNGLQTYEDSMKDKVKKPKPQVSNKGKSKVELVSEEKPPVVRSSAKYTGIGENQYQSPMDYDPLSRLSSSMMAEDSTVDAVSEKDLGNEYFKKKKFNEAIDCYSRSIALSPTAVAYANRAMCYLKIKRFQEAEDDCSEALNLDDRYIKAYSRRATARKEIGKLRDSLEDVEFALRLEPNNDDLKKQRTEVKSLLEKAILARAAGTGKRPMQGVKEIEKKIDALSPVKRPLSSNGSKKAGVDVIPDIKQVSVSKSTNSGNIAAKNNVSDEKIRRQVNGSTQAVPNSSHMKSNKSTKELETSVQELASRAASRAKAEAAKNITVPKSAYQFEASWRGFSGDCFLQSRLLKVTPPGALPQIFKNALTAPLLVDIIKCLATLFTEETELVVKYLENFTKVPRFDMIILCLPTADKADLGRIWTEVFLSKTAPIESAEVLSELYPKYCPGR